jgi:2'-5' RNA ligase
MRVFVGIDIDDALRERIQRFLEGVREFAPDVRWVGPESLHLTLKFIGEKPPETVEQIKHALAAIRGTQIEITFRGYGFFPTMRATRVFWIGIEAGQALAALAVTVDEATAALGIPKEERGFSPHLTLARGGQGSGAPQRQRGDRANQSFQRLQEKLTVLPSPEFGSMTAREFFLYESQLSRSGSRYTKIARFELH